MSKDKPVVSIEIISDTSWPWCFIVKRRLESAMAAFSKEVSFEVIWKPFFLNPTLTKALPLVQHLSNMYGPEAAANIVKPTSRLSKDGADVGIYFNANRLVVNTLKSHCMLDFAKTQGKQDLLAEKLFHAFFEEAKNIDSDEGLSKIAEEIELDWGAAQKHMAEVKSRILHEAMKARENGIRGVPYITFFINGRMGTNLSGARAAGDYVEIFQHLLTKFKAGA